MLHCNLISVLLLILGSKNRTYFPKITGIIADLLSKSLKCENRWSKCRDARKPIIKTFRQLSELFSICEQRDIADTSIRELKCLLNTLAGCLCHVGNGRKKRLFLTHTKCLVHNELLKQSHEKRMKRPKKKNRFISVSVIVCANGSLLFHSLPTT